MKFVWDPSKARRNLTKHGVSFQDASTAFADPLSLTIDDPDHSTREVRFLLVAQTRYGRLVVVSHTIRGETVRSSVLGLLNVMSGARTKKAENLELRASYDFSKGVRGKYAAPYRKGSNVVVLAPDVAKTFKTSAAVNRALRQVARSRRVGGG